MAIYSERKIQLKDGTEAVIRSPMLTDALAFMNYAKHIFQTSPFLITEPDEFVMDLKKHQQGIETLNNSTGGLFLLVLVNEKIVGNLDFKSVETRKRLAHRGSFGMSVIEDFRGKGVGKALLNALIDWAKSPTNAIEKIELGVLAENESALQLYRKMGFQQEGLIKKAARISADKYLDEIQMGLFIRT